MYSEDVASRICAELSAGRSLRDICQDADMPDKATVFRWLTANEGFRDQYARAREAQADAMLDDILDIADQYDNLADKIDVEHIQRAKLRIDTRKWAMSKMAPKKYADRIDHNVDGTVTVQLVRFADDPPAQ